jgi:uncharacterized protein YcnI
MTRRDAHKESTPMASHPARRLVGALAGTTLLMALAVPASAHVSIIDGDAVPGGGHGTQITFRIPHGCEGAATDTVVVQIPEDVTGVKPKWMAGWTIETQPRATGETPAVPDASAAADASAVPEGSAAPAEAEVGIVTWTGGPLPDDQYLDFQLLAVFPETPGQVYFPIIQRCGDSEAAWIEIPAAGQTEDDLEYPAPVVTVVEAEDHDD